MKRRSIVTGLGIGVFAGVGGGLAGFTLGVRGTEKNLDLEAFLQRNAGVKFHHLPTRLLLKLYSRRLTDADRMALVHGLVHHNSALFVDDPYARSLGTPGFYRVVS